jgi:hypothetical protein
MSLRVTADRSPAQSMCRRHGRRLLNLRETHACERGNFPFQPKFSRNRRGEIAKLARGAGGNSIAHHLEAMRAPIITSGITSPQGPGDGVLNIAHEAAGTTL